MSLNFYVTFYVTHVTQSKRAISQPNLPCCSKRAVSKFALKDIFAHRDPLQPISKHINCLLTQYCGQDFVNFKTISWIIPKGRLAIILVCLSSSFLCQFLQMCAFSILGPTPAVQRDYLLSTNQSERLDTLKLG